MLITICFLMSFYGCNNSNQKDYLKEVESEQERKNANLAIASDSIVSLSFCGLNLGEPVSPMINNAIKDKKIWDVKTEEGIVRFKTNIFLSERENPLCVDVVATSFNDSIARICLVSEDYNTYQQLIELFISRYNDKYMSSLQWSYIWGNNEIFLHKNVNLWDRDASHDGKSWAFNNQSLHVVHEYTTEEHLILKDSRMKSPENRYGVNRTNNFKRVIILYNDNKLCKKAEEHQKAVEVKINAAKRNEIEAKRQKQIDNALKQDI